MSTRRLLLPTWFALTLTALGLLAAAGRSAPAAKEAAPVKTPDGGIVAEPAGGDEAGQELARKASQ